MEKLITLLTLKLLIKDEKTIVRIYDNIFSEKSETKKPVSKKENELSESLKYLKSKKVKSKKDKESIDILEKVLMNMS